MNGWSITRVPLFTGGQLYRFIHQMLVNGNFHVMTRYYTWSV